MGPSCGVGLSFFSVSTALITSYAGVNLKKKRGEKLLQTATFTNSLDRRTSDVPIEMRLVLLQPWKFSLGALENQ